MALFLFCDRWCQPVAVANCASLFGDIDANRTPGYAASASDAP
jgi:hypothetical protein